MSLLESIILGVVQGATEFIPISSSGHLILVRSFFGAASNLDLAYDAVLQMATAFAVIVSFRKDLFALTKALIHRLRGYNVPSKEGTLINALILGTIPAIVLGLFLESYMESVFRNVYLVAGALLLGSFLMFYAEKVFQGKEILTSKKGFWLGFFQSLALIPGVSRSGATISGGMILGLSREEATRFSFLLAVPILFGSGLKKFGDLLLSGDPQMFGLPLLVSSVIAFCVGLLAIRFLLQFLKTRTLLPFIIYRIVLAFAIFIFV